MSEDPGTIAEWREAALGADALLLIDAGQQYGLITGGPKANVERCEEIVRRASKIGIRHTREQVNDCAREIIAEWNGRGTSGAPPTNADAHRLRDQRREVRR